MAPTLMLKSVPSTWGLDELRKIYPDLRKRPSSDDSVVLEGTVEFLAKNPVHGDILERFEIRLRVPPGFPRVLPCVWELGGRIPRTFHTNPGDRTLCLGSPLQLFITLGPRPTLLGFVNLCLVPYLYNFLVGQRSGTLPFGELPHGTPGLVEEYQRLLRVTSMAQVVALFRLLGLKKRIANKAPCPCGSGRRVGQCHNRILNRLRCVQSRAWYRKERSAWIEKIEPSNVLRAAVSGMA